MSRRERRGRSSYYTQKGTLHSTDQVMAIYELNLTVTPSPAMHVWWSLGLAI